MNFNQSFPGQQAISVQGYCAFVNGHLPIAGTLLVNEDVPGTTLSSRSLQWKHKRCFLTAGTFPMNFLRNYLLLIPWNWALNLVLGCDLSPETSLKTSTG